MKPIVRYQANTPSTMMLILRDSMDKPFWCARLDVIDHPKLKNRKPGECIRTSEIISFNPVGGIIETANTIYVPEMK